MHAMPVPLENALLQQAPKKDSWVEVARALGHVREMYDNNYQKVFAEAEKEQSPGASEENQYDS